MDSNRKYTLALIYGGRGYESDVSVKGAERIMPLIDREKYRTLSVFIDKDGRWLCNGGEVFPAYLKGISGLCREGEMIGVDCAIPMLHGDFGEDGVVQGALENAKIPYIGCGVTAGAVCSDKALTKRIAKSLGIPHLPWIEIENENDYALVEGRFPYPVIVKPLTLGSSVGITKAKNRCELVFGLKIALSFGRCAMVEPCIEHPRELECGYFRDNCKEIFTSPGEIVCKNGFYDYESKYILKDSAGVFTQADLSCEIEAAIKDYSKSLVRAIGIKGLCRVDFFLDGDRLYFNEINTMPGFTKGSLYPEMLENNGVETSDMIDRLIRYAMTDV